MAVEAHYRPESLAARRARVDARLVVLQLVVNTEVVPTRVPVSTQVADVGVFPGVGHDVPGQQRLADELRAAVAAHVALRLVNEGHVSPQAVLGGEHFTTLFAAVLPLLRRG